MFIDAASAPHDGVIETDICIIGAGAAGITFALECEDAPFRVCLLESGNFDFDGDTQDLYQGTIRDSHSRPLDEVRLRYFGGSTNHWSGRSRPMDQLDFQQRAWVQHSGWPISRDQLEPYYRRAESYCEIPSSNYEMPAAIFENPLADASDVLQLGAYHYSPPTRFGTVYRDQLDKVGNVTVYLGANVTEIEVNETGTEVERLAVATIGGNRFFVKSKFYILATGGIENARLLLASNSRLPQGVGNRYDLVGRFFMDHPIIWEAGWVFFTNPQNAIDSFNRPLFEGAEFAPFYSPTPAAQEREGLLNCGFDLRSNTFSSQGANALRVVGRELRKGQLPDDFLQHVGQMITDIDGIGRTAVGMLFPNSAPMEVDSKHAFLVRYWAEPAPNPNSRVTLGTERDKLGMPRTVLDWQMTEQDRHTFSRMLELLGTELGRTGAGRLRIGFGSTADEVFEQSMTSYHHMGTTRMHTDPRQGVVDADCRVHDMSNLYVAGSSVFPTCGQVNPTLNLVAVTIRLADHIKQGMS
jgi:choline dehydrogenase-like flavoprotein